MPKSKEAEETRLVRVLNMILDLACRGGKTKKELSETYQITTRQVMRDLDSLRRVGIDIEPVGYAPESGVEKRFCIPDRAPFHPAFQLNHDEAFVLAYCLALSRRDVSAVSRADLDAMRAKLNVLLPKKVAEYADGLARLYVPMNQPHPVEQYDPVLLRDIESAVLTKTWLQFTYKSRKKARQAYTVAPHAILSYHGHLYLLGHVDRHASEDPVLFSITQIEDLQNIEDEEGIEAIKVPFPDYTFDADEWVQGAFGIYKEEPLTVEVMFSKDAVDSVKRNVFHPSQTVEMQDDGRARVTLCAGGYYEILWWVMGFGAKAEVVKPKKMRDEIIRTFQEALKLYEDGGKT